MKKQGPYLSPVQFEIKMDGVIKIERHATNEIIDMIREALKRRVYLELGYSSMHDWLVRRFGYSKAAAQRRIDAARLLSSLPEIANTVSEKIEAGVLNLSTVSKAQAAVRCQEVETGSKVSKELKVQILKEIENKSVLETEQILCKHLPATVSSVYQERKVVINETTVRHSMNLSNDVCADLKRAKDLLSHKFPNGSDADVIAYALKFLLDKTDPLRKEKANSLRRIEKSVPSQMRKDLKSVTRRNYRNTLKSSDGTCVYIHPETGRKCGSTYQVQVDHKIARALGGSNDRFNLRPLCRQHNLFEAEKVFGKRKMDQYRLPGF